MNATMTTGTYEQVSLGVIIPSTTNPRKIFDDASMADLTASVREAGVQSPILLRAAGDGFEIVCGERRYRAALAAGLDTIPAIVREMDDDAALEAQIVENLQRAGVHPIEEADAYAAMIARDGFGPANAEDVAKRVGKTVAYVAQRLKLLALAGVAKDLFVEGHITLGHALLLARLMPADQDRAARELLSASGDYAKMSTAEIFAARKKNLATNQYVQHHRLIDDTEGELKEWIAANVMLKLKTAPWGLEDAQLVPSAGSCTACPKRSGSNAALFADMTPDQDVCLDAACYGVKHKAFIVLMTQRAAESGEPLLKLTVKSGHKKLPEPLYLTQEKKKGGGTEPTSIVFRDGQWMKAKKGSCTTVHRGILIDESSRYAQGDRYAAGDIISVCVDQQCKIHKHVVDRLVAGSKANTPKQESYEDRQKREKAEAAVLRAKDGPILRAVYDAMLAKLTPANLYLQSLLLGEAERYAGLICTEMGIVTPSPKSNDSAVRELKAFLASAKVEQLHQVAFHALLIGELHPPDHWLLGYRKGIGEKLYPAAKLMGVDTKAIAKAAVPKPVKVAADAKKSAAKPAVKPVAKKPAVKKLSPAGRKQIAAAMKKRWAERRTATAARRKKATG